MRGFERAASWHPRSNPVGKPGKLSDCFRRIRDAETALADARLSLTEFCENDEEHVAIRNKVRSNSYWVAQAKASKRVIPQRGNARNRTQPARMAMHPPTKAFKLSKSATNEAITHHDSARHAAGLTMEESHPLPQAGGSVLQRMNSLGEALVNPTPGFDHEVSPTCGDDTTSTGLMFSDGFFEPSVLISRRSSTKSMDDDSKQPVELPTIPSDYGVSSEDSERDESRGMLQHAIFDQVVLSQSQFQMEARQNFPDVPRSPKVPREGSPASWPSPTKWASLLPKSTFASEPVPAAGIKGEAELWQAKKDLSWEKTGKCNMPVLNPGSKKRLLWLLLGLCFIVYEAWMIPFLLAFHVVHKGFLLILAHLVTIYFVVDVLVTFFTGYVDRSGHLVFSLDRIAWRYARTWLVLDLIAAIPWIWLSPETMNQRVTRGAKFVRFARLVHVFRLARLLRMMKLKSLTDIFDTFLEANQTVLFASGVFRVMAWLFAAMHWTACIWYAVGEAGEEASWIKSLPEPDLTISESYIWSLYFTMTTMTTVGYGDIHPVNFRECCFALGLLPVASVLFATLTGALTTLISNINHRNRKITERRLMLTRYLNWRAVPTNLKIRMRQHLLFFWDMKEGYDIYEEEMKSCLPPVLKVELCYHLYGYQLDRAPFLEWMKDYPICMKNLSSMVTSMFLERGDHLFREGDANEEVYMFLSGVMWLSLNQNLHEGSEEFTESQAARDGSGILQGVTVPKKNGALLEVGVALGKMARKPTGKKEDEPIGWRGVAAPSIFDSTIFLEAGLKLHLHRSNEYKAALVVQRWWRKKKEWDRDHGCITKTHSAKSPKLLPVGRTESKKPRGPLLASQQIKAPAYFGESCLWVPLDLWTDSPPLSYKYTARCVQRAEFLHIPRSAVLTVINQFSPWLASRFNIFRDAVFVGLKSQVAEEDEASMADVEPNACGSTQAYAEQNGGSSASQDMLRWRKHSSVSFSDASPRSSEKKSLLKSLTEGEAGDERQVIDATSCSTELPGATHDSCR